MGKTLSLEKDHHRKDANQKALDFFLKESKTPMWKSVLIIAIMTTLLAIIVALSYNQGAILQKILSENSQSPISEQLQNSIKNIPSELTKGEGIDSEIPYQM